MSKALKGVPEKERVMPAGVVNVGGEVYYVENQPGQGVNSLGLDDPLPNEDGSPKPEPDGSTPVPAEPTRPPDPAKPTAPKYEDPRDRTFGT